MDLRDAGNADEQAISVVAAIPADLPLILRFIHKQARFDGTPHPVAATEAALATYLFGAQPAAFVLLAELAGRVAGFALWFPTFSSVLARPGIWLDALYVDEDVRDRGVGSALLTHLAAIAARKGYGRIEWTAAVDDAGGLGFSERHGAEAQEAVRVLRLDQRAIAALAALDAQNAEIYPCPGP
jgi:GNAT superfamily N-acetyltransferase